MRHLIAALGVILAFPAYALDGFKPPDQLINPLVDELLLEINQLLKLNIPEERPEVYLSSRDQIVKAFCDNDKPCNVAAVTDNKSGIIYLDTKLELNSIHNVSILYHELVHFIQIKNNMFSSLSECHKWAAAEMHAYKAQSDWLIYHGMKGFPVPDLSKQCD